MKKLPVLSTLLLAATALTTLVQTAISAAVISKAKSDTGLNTIALPPNWANYGEIMDSFQKKYNLKITNASPQASSATTPKAVAQSYRTITLINNNNQQILAGYIKNPESKNWSYAFDITEWFERNTSKKINVNTSQCIYDIKMIYISGSFDYVRYDTCKGNNITYVGNGGDYSPSGVYIGAKGCQYTPTYGVPGSLPLGC